MRYRNVMGWFAGTETNPVNDAFSIFLDKQVNYKREGGGGGREGGKEEEEEGEGRKDESGVYEKEQNNTEGRVSVY